MRDDVFVAVGVVGEIDEANMRHKFIVPVGLQPAEKAMFNEVLNLEKNSHNH